MALNRKLRLPVRSGRGTVLVHQSQLDQYDCPACNGDGHALKSELEPFRIHSERAWLCGVCGGTGYIVATSRTYKDLAASFKETTKVFFVGGTKN